MTNFLSALFKFVNALAWLTIPLFVIAVSIKYLIN
jgi:hypothetical protein